MQVVLASVNAKRDIKCASIVVPQQFHDVRVTWQMYWPWSSFRGCLLAREVIAHMHLRPLSHIYYSLAIPSSPSDVQDD